jgi:hypothetical protein
MSWHQEIHGVSLCLYDGFHGAPIFDTCHPTLVLTETGWGEVTEKRVYQSHHRVGLTLEILWEGIETYWKMFDRKPGLIRVHRDGSAYSVSLCAAGEPESVE